MNRRCLFVRIVTAVLTLPLSGCHYGELVRLYFQEQEYQKDQELIARIKGAFYADPRIGQAPVAVDAYLGDVWLSGTLASAEQVRAAKAVAAEVEGVESVTNGMNVKVPG